TLLKSESINVYMLRKFSMRILSKREKSKLNHCSEAERGTNLRTYQSADNRQASPIAFSFDDSLQSHWPRNVPKPSARARGKDQTSKVIVSSGHKNVQTTTKAYVRLMMLNQNDLFGGMHAKPNSGNVVW